MSVTPNLGLTKPDVGSTGWGSDINTNWDTLDSIYTAPSSTERHVYPGDSIQDAIDDVAALGGTVYLHPGVHTFASTLTITDGDGFSLIGFGQKTILQYTGTGVAIDVVVDAVGSDDVMMKDFRLEATGGTPGTHGIRVASDSQYAHLYVRLGIRGFSTAAIEFGGTNIIGFLVFGCNLTNNGIGIIGAKMTRGRIANNTFFNNTTHGLQLKNTCKYVKVVGNEIYRGSTAGISVEGSSASTDCLIETNTLDGQTGSGIKVDSSNRIAVVGNVVNGATSNGILANAATDLVISCNICASCGGDGIALTNVDQTVVTGNRCKSNTGNGISADSSCDQNVFEGNETRGNTAFGLLDNGTSAQTETFKLFSDFEDTLNGTPFTAAASGTGASGGTAGTGDTNHTGVVQISTGTTTTGNGGFMTAATALRLSGGDAVIEALVRVPTLPDGTDSFAFRVGFGDSAGADMTDGAYFELTQASANWQCATASNSTRTKTNSSTAAAANTWTRLKITVNAAGTSVKFYINGTLVATNTTNIPTAAGRETGLATNIVKSAGTTARTADVDYLQASIVYTTSR